MSYDNQESKNEVLRSANSREIAVDVSIKEMEAIVNRLEITTRPFTVDQFAEISEHSLAAGQSEVRMAEYRPEISSLAGASQNAKLSAPSIADMNAYIEERIKS